MDRVRLGGRWVGRGEPPFVVAEVGINHNGELGKAFEMIALAKKAGADAVKFQTFRAADLIGDPRQLFTYRSQGREVTEPMLDLLRRNEFSPRQWREIKRRCDKEGIFFLSTPQNLSDLRLLRRLGARAIKVGSDDFTHLAQLKAFAATGLPMIVSSGMSDLAEVHQALEAIGSLEGHPTVLLVCTSQYPTPPEDAHLRRIATLAAAYPGLPIGFSDHTQGPLASSLAVALGACLLEKHFTLDHGLPGPDHWFSEDPDGLREWVASIRRAHRLLGSPLVRYTREERAMRAFARRSVIALKAVRRGERLDRSRVGLMRPGTGLPPALFESVLGRRATRAIAKGEPVKLGDFA